MTTEHCPRTTDLRLWPILPAKPKKIDGEQGNEPPIIVLFVDRPFAGELPAQDEPERTEKEIRQDDAR